MGSRIRYVAGASRPSTTISWYENGVLLDFSSGYTFTAKVFIEGASASSFTKSSGITGAATDPNLTISWLTTDLGALAAGNYVLEVSAVNGAATYRRQWGLTIAPAAPT